MIIGLLNVLTWIYYRVVQRVRLLSQKVLYTKIQSIRRQPGFGSPQLVLRQLAEFIRSKPPVIAAFVSNITCAFSNFPVIQSPATPRLPLGHPRRPVHSRLRPASRPQRRQRRTPGCQRTPCRNRSTGPGTQDAEATYPRRVKRPTTSLPTSVAVTTPMSRPWVRSAPPSSPDSSSACSRPSWGRETRIHQ